MTSDQIIATILDKRGILPEDREHFLQPDFVRDIHAAAHLPDAPKAAERIARAVKEHESIVLFGDYDADGVPGTALALRILRKWGAKVEGLIPRRVDGYGLTPPAVARILELKPAVVITIDNGTVSTDAIAELQAAGCDCIVTDHHEPHGELPNAYAVVNAKREDSEYPFRELCGAAVIWKVLWHTAELLGEPTDLLKWEIDLVGFSTIADMVPLVGENRVLATYGLKTLAKTRNLGIQALAVTAGVDLPSLSAGQVGFHIAPRINAPSRQFDEYLEDGRNIALTLLTTDDPQEAHMLAERSGQANAQRQKDVQQACEEALAQCVPDATIQVVWGEAWGGGIVGLVAGRVLERTGVPVIACSLEGDEWRASVRSGQMVDTLELFEAISQHLDRFGGHARAGGCSLKAGVAPETLREPLQQWMTGLGHTLPELKAAQRAQPDLELTVADCTLEVARVLESLAPFGIGFAEPRFTVRGTISGLRRVGATQAHAQCMLTDGTNQLKCIWFSAPQDLPKEGDEVALVITLDRSVYRGVASVQGTICYCA